jgi:branched-chain amino acid transport system substrate-binding protein
MKRWIRFFIILTLCGLMPVSIQALAQEEPGIGAWDTCPTPENLPEEVNLGVVFGLSGSVAVYGEPQQQGVELAVAEVNESGYLGEGTTLVAVVEDGGSDAEASIAAMENLVAEGNISVILGPTLSTQAFAADPVAAEAGIPVMGVSNTATGITTMNDDPELDQFVFRNSLPESAVIPGVITQSLEILGLERVGVLYGNDDDFTVSGYEVFKQALEENGVEITREETFARGDVDFSPQLTNIINDDPDAIVVSALVAEAVPLVIQARQLGYTGPIIGGNGFNSPALFEQAGDAAEGVIVGAAWNISSEAALSQAFSEAYQEAYDSAPDQFAAQAYTGAWLAATAIRCADAADPAAVRDALAAIADFDSPLGMYSFDEERNPVHEPVAQIVLGGRFEVLTPETAAQVFGEE